MKNECAAVARNLGVFLDGRLTGASRVQVVEHVGKCQSCAEALAGYREVGRALRDAAAANGGWIDTRLAGLANRVVGRVRAEERFSWRQVLTRCFEGWRWAIVGAGAVAGTAISTGFVSMLLAYGPAQARDDSLSALLGNLASPPGHVFLFVSSVDDVGGVSMLEVDNGMPRASRLVAALAHSSQASLRPSEADLVGELASHVTRGGQVRSLGSMDRVTRARTEALFGEITSMRERAAPLERTVSVRAVRLVTSVTAKS